MHTDKQPPQLPDFFHEVINSIKVGIFVTDGEGRVITLNTESEKTGGLSKEELIGRHITDLVAEGYMEESCVQKVLASGKEESLIQNLGDGGQLFLTAVPIKKEEDILFVICTERDISETIHLQKLLNKNIEKTAKYEEELAYFRSQTLENAEIIADSQAMKNVMERAAKIAQYDTTVLLTGESGTGKEVLANFIYKKSLRSNKPFIKVNCAAIPENLLESEMFGYEKGAFSGADRHGKLGLFELADKGTFFLDEIGDLSVTMQAKLLRALQEQEIMRIGGKASIPIDVRIIAATNKNLEVELTKNNFREDLFYRLNIFPIKLPPLRFRLDDIKGLAYYFINQYNKNYSMEKIIDDSAINALASYNWPGNIREFRNIIERIFIDTDGTRINKFHVIKHLRFNKFDPELYYDDSSFSLEEALKNYEKEIILNLMSKYNNGSKVAKMLKVHKSTISKKMKEYNKR